jgi:hypothetical protein
VTWNCGRALEKKVAALERLIVATEEPMFLALQEIGDASFEMTTLAAVTAKYKYAAFCSRRAFGSKTAGGAALLVKSDVPAQPCAWPEADAWDECEVASVSVQPADGSPPFTVTSWYVHGGSEDTRGFEKVLNSAGTNRVILGDLNAQMSSENDKRIGTHFARRGEHLAEYIEATGAMYPAPSGPTRYATKKVDGKVVKLDEGTVNDHIVVGADVYSRICAAECESLVLEGDWGSDHEPLVWSAAIGIVGPVRHEWCRQVAWHRIEAVHVARFNECVRARLKRARASRDLMMITVETALIVASRSWLPHTRPRHARDGLYWTEAAKQRISQTVGQHGDGARGEISASYTAARRELLAANAQVNPNPSSGWGFLRRFWGFKAEVSLRPPLQVTDGPDPETTTDPAKRVEVLAEYFAAAHRSPQGDPAAGIPAVDAQQDLKDLVRDDISTIKKQDLPKWQTAGVTELKACIAAFATGRCADFLGVRAEHLRLLTDETLAELVPFIDRCLSLASLPTHWCSARVTPVPKRKRDLGPRRSWRPVSVTPLLCRLCETVLHNRVSHVIEHGGHRRGQSQFGFRRGVSTAMPLSGLSMFIRDGFRQKEHFMEWDARDPNLRHSVRWGAQSGRKPTVRAHSTLLTSIDGSDAFCRALPVKAVQKLLDMGLINEARWIAALLTERTLIVKENGHASSPQRLERGVPQGSVLGPLLWSLVIDSLIERLEEACRTPIPGCVAVPIVFADDINFAVRGFNPTSAIAQTNLLMDITREWAADNGVPMAKLQALWITGGNHCPWARSWKAEDGEIVFDATVRCVPSIEPMKLLGVTFDNGFTFGNHVDNLVDTGDKHLKLITALSGVVKAEKIKVLYEGVILSRLLYAIDAWYPHVTETDRKRLQSLHYRACRAITGCIKTSHGESVCYEAGFRMFDEVARDEITGLADRIRRVPDGCRTLALPEVCFGPAWVARLSRDGAMPTAAVRPMVRANGVVRAAAAFWPPIGWQRDITEVASDCHSDSVWHNSVRDIGVTMRCGMPQEKRADPRHLIGNLRPLPRAHPFAPHELIRFDSLVRFITDAPGGLIKPDSSELQTAAQMKPFGDANRARMEALASDNAGALYMFTDGSRVEGSNRGPLEKCAGAFAICDGPDPRVEGAVLYRAPVPVSPIACVYSAELGAIDAGLEYLLNNPHLLRHEDGTPRKLVAVTDSRSSLESLRTTWLRRIGHLEQTVTRHLHDIAGLGVRVTLAFVFSHVGGAPGNHYADEYATEMCDRHGTIWTRDLWSVDSTRRVLKDRHGTVDAGAGTPAGCANRDPEHKSFRFRHLPRDWRGRPSDRLPRDMSRPQEKDVYRARLGMMPAAGGGRYGCEQDCPLCGKEDAMCRGGGTITHLVECLPDFTEPPLRIEISQLWSDPTAAARLLDTALGVVRATPQVRERQTAFELRKKAGRRK